MKDNVALIATSTFQLRDVILAEARARGVPLEQRGLRIEHDLPVFRLRCGEKIIRGSWVRFPGEQRSSTFPPDVITVHGSGDRASRTWPRKRDGSFNCRAITDHLLTLVELEMAQPKRDFHVPVGVPAAASGLHVVHLAGVQLGVIEPTAKAGDLVKPIQDERIRARIESHLLRGGLTDGDLRILGDASGLSVRRTNSIDFDPFEPITDRLVTILRVAEAKGRDAERRYVLLLDRRGDEVVLVDPSGKGLTVVNPTALNEVWKLGATTGRPWIAFIGVGWPADLRQPASR